MKKSMKRRRIAGNVIAEITLILLSVIWLVPIVWIILQAFRKEPGAITYTFFPEELPPHRHHLHSLHRQAT